MKPTESIQTRVDSNDVGEAANPGGRGRAVDWLIPTVFAVSFLVMVLTVTVSGRRIGAYTRDPAQLGDLAPLEGSISLLGSGATAAAFGVILLATVSSAAHHRIALAAVGVATLGLFLDDTLLFHEQLLPAVGIPELVVYLTYVLGAAVLVVPTARLAVASRTTELFGAAVALFGASIALDVIDPVGWGNNLLFAIEDGVKFVGLGFWFSAVWRLSRFAISQTNRPPTP